MLLMMSLGFRCLAAPSGPPLAASQGNSRARTLHSLAAPVTRAAHYLVLARRPVLALVSVLRFVVSPLSLVKGKHSKPSKETP